VLGPLLMRQTTLEAIDLPVLRALGSSPRQRFAVGAAWAAPVGVVAGLTAVVVATLGSWWTPIGVARIVEPEPGPAFDGLVFGIGAVVIGAGVVLFAAVPAFRLARSRPAGADAANRRPSRAVAMLGQASLPPPALTGVRMALEPGQGRSSAPVRSSLAAITLGVLTLTASLTFGAAVRHVLDTPRLVGWNWDSWLAYPADAVGDENVPVPRDDVVAALAAHPDVEAFGLGAIWSDLIELGDDRVPVALLSFDAAAGSIGPSIVHGRAPAAADELLLGPMTADALGVGVGDAVVAHGQIGEPRTSETYEDTAITMEVVGIGVLPPFTGDRLGNGAATTPDGLRLLAGEAPLDSMFLRYAPGADPPTVVRELVADLGLPPRDPITLADELSVVDTFPVLDVRQVDRLPLLVAAVMALMSVAVLAHVLVSAVSARRREVAVLRAIGFGPRQVRQTVAYQAATIAAVAIAIGLPLGTVVGRAAWLVYADRIGVVPEAVVPVTLALVPLAVLFTALVVATLPGWMASRPRPAVALRSE
jgi:FtsX-like permease family